MEKRPTLREMALDPCARFTDAQRRVIEDVRKMTIEEGIESLISSGILTKDRKLATPYNGEPVRG